MKQGCEHLAYLSLGTNLGDKLLNLGKACGLIQEICGTIEGKSGIYSSKPWGFESDNDFYNLCLKVMTSLDPGMLLMKLISIEQKMGRRRGGEGYSDRIIDIDILFYDDLIMDEENLIIPHPKMHERLFVLAPLEELTPDFIHPAFRKTVKELLEKCEGMGSLDRVE